MTSLLWRWSTGVAIRGVVVRGATVRGSCVGVLECVGELASDCKRSHNAPSRTSAAWTLRSLKRSSSGLLLLPPASLESDLGLSPRSDSSSPGEWDLSDRPEGDVEDDDTWVWAINSPTGAVADDRDVSASPPLK